MAKLKVPESARQVVDVSEISGKQEMVDYETKKGEKRQKPRFMVRVHDDGKQATMTDMENPEYKKYQEQRAEISKNKIKLDKDVYRARLAHQREIGNREGMRDGKRLYREEILPKKLDTAYKRGLADGKPQVNKIERATKLEEKAREMMARAEKLKGDVIPPTEKKAPKKEAAKPKVEQTEEEVAPSQE